MRQKMISRRDAFSLLGLAVALGFAVPTTVLTTSDAEAQAAAPATTAPATNAPAMSGMQRRRAARQTAREMRREARQTAREMRREGHDKRLARRDVKRGKRLAVCGVRPTRRWSALHERWSTHKTIVVRRPFISNE